MSITQFSGPLIRIKSVPDTPLSRLSRTFSGSLNRRWQAQLVQTYFAYFVHFYKGPKQGEDLKENAALPMPPKGPKASNFIEFYKNRRHTEKRGDLAVVCHHPIRRVYGLAN